jgi:hypothetical protein
VSGSAPSALRRKFRSLHAADTTIMVASTDRPNDTTNIPNSYN